MDYLEPIKQKIEQEGIHGIQSIENEVELSDSDLRELLKFAAEKSSFAVVEYLLTAYNANFQITDGIYLQEPINRFSYEHARYLITKQLLQKYNIKYHSVVLF